MGSHQSTPVQIQQALQVLRRQAIPSLTIGLTLGLLTTLALALRPPTYTAEGKFRFERLSPTSSLTGLGKEAADPQPLGLVSNPLNNEAETLRSRPLIQKTITKLNLQDKQGNPLTPETFLRSLKVKDLLASDHHGYSLQQPRTRRNRRHRQHPHGDLPRAIQQRIPPAQHHRPTLPRKTTPPGRNHRQTSRKRPVPIHDPAPIGRHQRPSQRRHHPDHPTSKNKIASVKAQLADTNAQTNILQEGLGSSWQDNLQSTTTSQSPALLEAMKELRQIEGALITARSLYQEDHPEIQALLAQQNRWQAIVTQNSPGLSQPLNPIQQEMTKDRLLLEQKRQGLTQQLSSLTQSSQQVQTLAQALPDLEKTQRQLQRQLEIAQLTYTQLMARLNDVRLAKSQNIGNARILAPAILPTKPSKSRLLPYLVGTLIGLLSAGATAWWRNDQDRTLDIDLAKQRLNYPILGVIPKK
ncbi:MAG: hypothetical protein HC860_17215 [Alkalinema sp. RU_4_3]|nr:hypothetical protein [Alkalinema sp. RU_4_3]